MHSSESLADDRAQREPRRWSRAEYERMADVGVLDLRQDRRRPPLAASAAAIRVADLPP